jgi:TolB-like protein/Flp pilus assembly protein TadD
MEFWKRARQRKIVQWALGYLAAAWLLLQVLHLLGATYSWPAALMRAIPVTLAGGFLAALVVAWHHGEKGRQRATLLELVTLAFVATATATAAVWLGARSADVGSQAAAAWSADPRSVAVLPFTNISGDPAQDYFADGITEEILNALSQIRELRVPARASSFFYREQNLPIREIAAQLGVGTVLLGRVRKEGSRVRINAQLIDARDDRHVWSDQFDHEAHDVFAVQSEIARAVARALHANLSSDSGALPGMPRRSAVAHDLYLQGLFYWNRRSSAHLEQAIRYFQEAAQADPTYGEAYAGLAAAHAVAPLLIRDRKVSEAVVSVEAAAARALALDPSLALAHAALGYIYHWQWRWEDAEREFRRALEANPNLPVALQWYGEHLAKLGRGEEGLEQLRRAVAIDPMSAVAHGNLGLVMVLADRIEEGMEQLERTHAMDPSLSFPLLVLHKYHVGSGNVDAAVRTGRLWAELSGLADPADVIALSEAVARPEHRPAALRVLGEWQRWPAPPWADIANYLLRMDLPDDAITALEQGYRDRDPMMTTIAASPWYERLRDDPRFRAILADMRLESVPGNP